MTVASTTSKIAYTGNGATTLFSFPYPFIAASDLQVYVAGVLKTLTTDYTISGTAPYPTGANVTFTSAPANLASIVIIRVRPFTQTMDLVANDPLPAESVEQDFDHVVMLAQQLNEAISRAITIPATDVTGTSVTLPAAASRANLALVFDASGNATVGSSVTTTVSAAMISVVQAATLALARVALGIGSNFTTEGTIVAAATTDLGSLSSQEIVITGNTGITSFGNTASLAAPLYFLRFTGTPVITNSANIIISGAANWTPAAGDMAIAKFEGTSVWRLFPLLASGKALIGPSSLSGVTIDNSVIGGTTPAAASVTQMNGGQLAGFRNAIINGGFQVWQRGTTYALTTSVAYGSADRWASNMATSAAGIFNRDTSIAAGLGFHYNGKVGRTAASALTNAITLAQALETENSIPLAGQLVTLSFYAKCGANYSPTSSLLAVKLSTGTGTDQSVANLVAGSWTGAANAISQNATLTTSWQKFSYSVTLGASITQLGVQFAMTPVGTAGADDNFYITGVQLELGAVATPYEQRGFGQELELSRRYYQKSFPYATAPAQSASVGGGFVAKNPIANAAPNSYVPFCPRMRAAPTVTTYNPSAANANWRNATAGADVVVVVDAPGALNDSGVSFGSNSTVATINDNLVIHWSASAEL